MRAFSLSLVAGLLLSLAACGGGSGSRPPASSSRQPSPALSAAATASSSAPKAVWVLTPLGLNVHSDASTSAPVVTVAAESAELDVSETRTAGDQTWLHVKTSGGSEGWILNDPTLVTATPVYAHIDTTLGYRILFPQTWTVTAGNPTAIASPPADPEGATLTIQEAPDPSKLSQTPTSAGKELRTESPIEVYGKTTFMTVYQLDKGGFEFAVKVQWAADRSYLFDYRQTARAQPDTALFKQLLISVAIA